MAKKTADTEDAQFAKDVADLAKDLAGDGGDLKDAVARATPIIQAMNDNLVVTRSGKVQPAKLGPSILDS